MIIVEGGILGGTGIRARWLHALGVAGLVLALTTGCSQGDAWSPESCDSGVAETSGAPSSDSDTIAPPPPPELAGSSEELKIEFGRSRDAVTDRKILTHKVQEGHEAATRTKTAVNLESFDIRTANGDALPGELVVTEAVYFDESLTVDFCVDVDRKEPKAGEYTGSLKIVGDTRDRPFEVPIVITIKDSAWHLALLTAMAGSVVGALWGLISALFLARGSSGSSPIKEDLQRVSAIAALAGVAIGAYVFIESYVASPDFAGGFPDRGLVSVGFAIGVTANPIVAAVNAFVTDMFSGDETEENP